MSEYTGTENLEVMAAAVNYNHFLVSLIQKEAHLGEKLVDFGAGIGTFAKSVSSGGYQVHCIEPDNRQLTRILELGLAASPDLACLEDASVDFLYTLNVLEHIEDDVSALKVCFEKIKPGGRLLIYVPAFKYFIRVWTEMSGTSEDTLVPNYRKKFVTQALMSQKVNM
jgi:predicted SAM-dependent methyltransferase